jgi:hypothetical protein
MIKLRETTRGILVAATGLVLLGATPAQAALPDYLALWFPQWFGDKDTGPKPEDTLQAPFSDSAGGTLPQQQSGGGVQYTSRDGQAMQVIEGEDGKSYEIPAYDSRSETTADLAIPHRQAAQIGDWLIRATSEIFTMDTHTYSQHMEHLATGMSPAGLAEFEKFLIDSNVLAEMQNNDMVLKGYVDEPPLLLNEGALNGRYRWLFEMPVTLTFLRRGEQSYAKVEDVTAQTYHFIVQTQIGRVAGAPTEDNVIIETWRVRQGSATKKP